MTLDQTSSNLYEGHVSKVEKVHTKKGTDYTLIHVRELSKPIAFNKIDSLPEKGDKISVQYSDWNGPWVFAVHRSLVIDRNKTFLIEELPNSDANRNEFVIGLILKWLKTNSQVTSDDIFEDAMRQYSSADPRFLGHAFRILAKSKKIHKVGMKKSARIWANHARDISVWELTKK